MAKCTSTPLWPLVSTAPNRYAEANNSHVVSVNHKEIVVYLTDSYTFAQESDPVLYRSFQKKITAAIKQTPCRRLQKATRAWKQPEREINER
jgi:hypothetical protein